LCTRDNLMDLASPIVWGPGFSSSLCPIRCLNTLNMPTATLKKLLVALQLLLDFRTLLPRQGTVLQQPIAAANRFISGLHVSFLYGQIGMYFLSRLCQLQGCASTTGASCRG